LLLPVSRWLRLSAPSGRKNLWLFPEELLNSVKPVEPDSPAGLTGVHSGETGSLPLSAEFAFDTILNETCSRLEDRRNRGIVKRIYKMEEILKTLEYDLNALLGNPAKGVL
jgi:hypothetical protein